MPNSVFAVIGNLALMSANPNPFDQTSSWSRTTPTAIARESSICDLPLHPSRKQAFRTVRVTGRYRSGVCTLSQATKGSVSVPTSPIRPKQGNQHTSPTKRGGLKTRRARQDRAPNVLTEIGTPSVRSTEGEPNASRLAGVVPVSARSEVSQNSLPVCLSNGNSNRLEVTRSQEWKPRTQFRFRPVNQC